MNNEDAIKKLEWLEFLRLMEGDIDSANALKIAVDAIEREEKYRWHDLRKNPDDLPEEGSTILVAAIVYGKEAWVVCDFCDGMFKDGVNPPMFLKRFIIAWREIEPYQNT